jgi:hypothetical protein
MIRLEKVVVINVFPLSDECAMKLLGELLTFIVNIYANLNEVSKTSSGAGPKMVGSMEDNKNMVTIGNVLTAGGSIMAGMGFVPFGPAALILGNGYLNGFDNAIDGGSFEQGFVKGAAVTAAMVGIGILGRSQILPNTESMPWYESPHYKWISPSEVLHLDNLPELTSNIFMSAKAVGRYLFTDAKNIQKLIPAGKWMNTDVFFQSNDPKIMSTSKYSTTDYDSRTVRSKTHIPTKEIYDGDFILSTPASPMILSTPGRAERTNVIGVRPYNNFDINQNQYSITVVSPQPDRALQSTYYQHFLRIKGYIRYGQEKTNVPGYGTGPLQRPWYHKWLYNVN